MAKQKRDLGKECVVDNSDKVATKIYGSSVMFVRKVKYKTSTGSGNKYALYGNYYITKTRLIEELERILKVIKEESSS